MSTPDRPVPLFVLPALPQRMELQALYPNPAPIEIEIGSGKGLFLTSAGVARPSHNFLGVEVVRKYARKGAERIAKAKIPNAIMLCADVLQIWDRVIGLTNIEAVHIYFPDPWWKKKHKKRRVFNSDFVTRVCAALRDGGDFHIATDVEEYFHTMVALVAEQPGFVRYPEIPNVVGDFEYLTNFERKYRIEGRPIYRAAYKLDRSRVLVRVVEPQVVDHSESTFTK